MIFNAIEYSEINCIYIYFSGKKRIFFRKKKITEIEKLWITSFIDFQSSLRKGELLVVEKRNYNLILLEKKKKRKEDRKIVRRKEVSAIQRIIFLRLCDKGKKEKETRGAVS